MAPTFDPPGHGQWALDRSHYPSPVTPISQWLLQEGFHHGFTRVFEELGMPAERVDVEFVHGFMYKRVRPLIGGDSKPRKPPPVPILKLATRLHPAFRRRNATAVKSLQGRPWIEVVKKWEDQLRPQLLSTNAEFQSFDVDAASDKELQHHITTLLDQVRNNAVLHFWLHGHDLGPIARYLRAALGWGLDPVEAISALAGASPATARPLATLLRLRELLEAHPEPIGSLDELAATSDEAAVLLDEYMTERGHVLVTGYDLHARTLIEMPQAVLSSIRAATPAPVHNADGIAGDLRNRLPADQRAMFDEHLQDARLVMDMRDDNGPLTLEWPIGLLRRALLGAADRLVERGDLANKEDIFEVTPVESRSLFDGSLAPLEDLAARSDRRAAQATLTPPALLGPDEPAPPLSALPPALAQLTETIQVAMTHVGLETVTDAVEPLAGTGIGDTGYVGIARVATSADEAIDRLMPGDILVVRATSPAFNAVLSIAGAVVTADGGVLSHAAVLSRELGIPAIIGAPGALDIADGSTIEVDPRAGLVRLVDSSQVS